MSSKILFELYNVLKTVVPPHHVKHSVSAIVLCALEDIEASGEPVTSEAIEKALAHTLAVYSGEEVSKKVS